MDGSTVRAIMGHSPDSEAMTEHYSSIRLAEKRAGVKTVAQVVQEAAGQGGPTGELEGKDGAEAEARQDASETEHGSDRAWGMDRIVDGGDPKGDPSR